MHTPMQVALPSFTNSPARLSNAKFCVELWPPAPAHGVATMGAPTVPLMPSFGMPTSPPASDSCAPAPMSMQRPAALLKMFELRLF